MAITITQTTINTGSMTFSNVEEFAFFMEDFSIVQQYSKITREAIAAGNAIRAYSVQQAPNIFVHTRAVINETIDTQLKNSISREAYNDLLTLLNWTSEQTISYEY